MSKNLHSAISLVYVASRNVLHPLAYTGQFLLTVLTGKHVDMDICRGLRVVV